VKEYIEESKPLFAVGEYWDSCEYSPPDYRLNYNQGKRIIITFLLITLVSDVAFA
jgi:alpha-amylase